jgi:alpha-glucuronidase
MRGEDEEVDGATVQGHHSWSPICSSINLCRKVILLHYHSCRFDHVELSTSDLIQRVRRIMKYQHATEARGLKPPHDP